MLVVQLGLTWLPLLKAATIIMDVWTILLGHAIDFTVAKLAVSILITF